MEHVLRQCLIALRLAERVGLGDEERSVVYYTALLVNVGCHADAHEQAKWFGGDIELKSHKYDHPPRSIAGVAASLRLVGSGNPPLHRFRVGVEFALSGHRDLDGMIAQHAALARALAGRARAARPRSRTRSGRRTSSGTGAAGPASCAATRSRSRRGWRSWPSTSRSRTGSAASRPRWLLAPRARRLPVRPAAGRSCCARTPRPLLGGLDGAHTWDAVIAAEPALGVTLSRTQLDAALLAVANFVDLKSPYRLGHARAVAELAGAAGAGLGLGAADRATLRRAGLVCGLGRLGVSNSIWDKRGPLGAGEWERVRLQPYLTERMLQQSALARPRSARSPCSSASAWTDRATRAACPGRRSRRRPASSAPPTPTRRCASARPYRPRAARGRRGAAELRARGAGGAHRTPTRSRPCWPRPATVPRAAATAPAGLTGREVEVLRLVARGLSSKQIAQRLVISPKTARNHIEHIYAKIGASSRAGASLFAMQHGLLPEEDYRRP